MEDGTRVLLETLEELCARWQQQYQDCIDSVATAERLKERLFKTVTLIRTTIDDLRR